MSHDAPEDLAPVQAEPGALDAQPDDPPVVARLVVEIRSDGSRTIARGAVEDHITGEKVGVQASAASPLELAGALARMLLSTPRLANRAINSTGASRGRRRAQLRSSLRNFARRRLGSDDSD